MTIALNDPNISETMDSIQESDGTPVSALRLARVKPWDQRIAEARDRLGGFEPDWVSFQFVPFGYHRKGLCAGLGKKLADLGAAVVSGAFCAGKKTVSTASLMETGRANASRPDANPHASPKINRVR